MRASQEVMAAARKYLAGGVNIVAVTLNKRPVAKAWSSRTFTEGEIMRDLTHGCVGIAHLGGRNGGIFGFDLDADAGEAWFRENCEAAGIDPDDFPTVETPGKVKADGSRRPGLHRYMTDVRGTVGNSRGDMKGLGIDPRGRGCTLLPPSPHPDGGFYTWRKGHRFEDFPDGIPPVPGFVYAALEAPEQRAEQARQEHKAGNGAAAPDAATHAYCRRVLDNARAELAAAMNGMRNEALNVKAMKLAQFAHYGAFSEGEARAALLAACEDNGLLAEDGDKQCTDTFSSGWRKGLIEPQDVPAGDSTGQRERKQDTRRTEESKEPQEGPEKFTVGYWLTRDLKAPDFLLGELFSTTSRVMQVGPTGSGKTNFAMAVNFAVAAGRDFLHWRCHRAARRVLYIDGEMSARLVRKRLQQAVTRHGFIPDNLIVVNRDDFPNLPPLDAPEGQQFVDRLIEQAGNVDMLTLDNVQSLVSGAMKDEEPWAAILPWIRNLTRRGIGQWWQHHTGHDESRSYGSKTREWQLDTVMMMKPRREDGAGLIDFDLEFPKARERSPENRSDFAPAHVWIGEDDQWHSSVMLGSRPAKAKPLPPDYQKALGFLDDVTADHGEFVASSSIPTNVRVVPIDLWRTRLQQRGLYEAGDRGRQWFQRVRNRLIGTNHIVIDGTFVWRCNKRDAP